ncbi:MAG: type II toxin-antitoxin system RelE/ParE family toxin [Armatimonadota bacterium]|nr:type II toxin-antitoxin system RelE/ParE family toxin [Armatimonadota bacterium]
MPRIDVLLYKDDDESVPIRLWLRTLHARVIAKCRTRLERLREVGHELRRPEADTLRDGIYELRAAYSGTNYRILYFFHGNLAAVVSHGIIKEAEVPPREIDLAVARKKKFETNPDSHSDRGWI